MVTLKALETLALERGRVSTGQVFQLHSKEAAQELIDSGRAKASDEEVTFAQPDAKPKAGKATRVRPADKPAEEAGQDSTVEPAE
ncbi:hypothetical protein GCM10027048_27770 [Hymenobacter coalescens]